MPYITSPQTPTLPSHSPADRADTAPAARTTSTHDTVDTRPERKRFLGLSLSQILGGSLAATTAAFLGARLGLAGTLAGAAIASVVSAIASAAYAHSIERTQSFLRTTRVVTTTTSRRVDAVDPATPPRELLRPSGPSDARGSAERTLSAPRTLRLDLRRVGLATLAVFAATAFAVTGYEFASGHSLDGKEGTTVSQVVSGGSHKPATTLPSTRATTSAPTPTATATATVTVTATQSPSATATGSPTSSVTSPTSPSPTASDPTTPAPTSTTPTP